MAIFDLDNTLLSGDSDYLWGVFLGEQGIVDADFYEKENERFYSEYKQGKLNIMEFLQFSLRPLSQHPVTDLHEWRAQFIEEKIRPLIGQPAIDLVEKHRQQGDDLLIITATNAFVTRPVADLFGIDELIATEPELIDGIYTGKVAGTPSFQHGKVERLNSWLEEKQQSMQGSFFYSDSHNDLPLLEIVENPVAVDPDDILRQTANEKNWPVLSLH